MYISSPGAQAYFTSGLIQLRKLTMAQLSGVALVAALLLSCVGALGRSRADQSTDRSSKTSTVDYRDHVSGVVIFGDSSVDVGVNNYLPLTLVRCDHVPYGRIFPGGIPTGRFCDGKLAIDFVVEKIGYPLPLPYLAPNAHGKAILTGLNFASSGSGWYDGTASNIFVKSLGEQLQWYKKWKEEVVSLVGQERGEFITRNSLHLISTGSNDWLNNYYFNPNLLRKYTPASYVTFLIGNARSHIQELYDLGALNIGVLGLAPLGCLPSQISMHGNGTSSCVDRINADVVHFNEQLISLINNELKPKFHGARLVYLDSYVAFTNIIENAQAYGISNTREGCCGTGTFEKATACNKGSTATCKDASSYLWWDVFHPTEYANTFLGTALVEQMEPILVGPRQP